MIERHSSALLRRAIRNSARANQLKLSTALVRPSSSLASSAYNSIDSLNSKAGPSNEAATSAIKSSPSNLTKKQRDELEKMLRVDHSGEIAANTIYIAQAKAFQFLGDRETSKMCWEMLKTEKKHLQIAEKLLMQHRIRPSIFNPIWSIAGSILGGTTAILGKEGAMAATEAVETVIGEHYDDQLKTLSSIKSHDGTVHPSIELLTKIVQEFRDDELEHLDTAVQHDAQQAPAHALLSAIIGFGCKGAIQIAKRF